jgi:diguanylate cyclase (GGDEF)-like protein
VSSLAPPSKEKNHVPIARPVRSTPSHWLRPVIVWLLAALAALAVGTSALMVAVVLPASSRLSQDEGVQLTAVGEIEALLAAQAGDEGAFLLSGDRRHLDEFEERRHSLTETAAVLRTEGTERERSALALALEPYGRFLAEHDALVRRAVDGDRAGALAVWLGAARGHQRDAAERFHALHDLIARESRAELDANHDTAVLLTLLLLALSFVPAATTFALGRALRRLGHEEAVAMERRRLADAQRVAHLGSWELDLRTGAVTWSDELYRILGCDAAAVAASLEGFLAVVHPDDVETVKASIAQGQADGGGFEYVNRIVRPDREVRWLANQGEFVLSPGGEPLTLVGTALDVTEIREAEDRLLEKEAQMRHRAYHDPLTGLPNRAMLLERLDDSLGAHASVAVMLLDLDGFKRINDSLGHAVGDQLLARVAERLTSSVRGAGGRIKSSEPRHPDTVSRLGGDEFAILLCGVDQAAAQTVADRVLESLTHVFRVDGRELRVSASVGIVMASWASNALDALRDADVAMYAAKDAGGGRVAVFDPAMHAAVVERLALEAELRDAIETGSLSVHYQPIVDPLTGAVDKLEALVRWAHPERGFLGPDRFIPLAEETGLIVPLGAWVLGEACRELTRHQERQPHMRVAVNLSARQLEAPDLTAVVAAALEESGLEPSRLVLEVTESILMEEGQGAVDALERLRGLGVALSIDDFGTGYSSLSRLRMLPVAELKIDKSFIDELDEAGDKAPVVAAIIALAHSLGRSVVAEGVEKAAQFAALTRLGCDRVQGYLLSRPLPPDELKELLAFPTPFSGIVRPDGAQDRGQINEEVMAAVARAVEAGADVDALVRPLLAELADLTGLESAYLTRIDFERGVQEIVVAHNAGAGTPLVPEGMQVPWQDTLCRRALASGQHLSGDVAVDFPDCTAAADAGIRSYAMAPVVGPGGDMLGTLCAAGAVTGAVDTRIVALMEVFSRLIGDALGRGDVGSARRLRVVIVDDSQAVRALLRQVLTADDSIEVVAEAADGRGAVAVCQAERPDVVLLDLEMPGLDGLAAMPLLAERSPGTKVVVLSASADGQHEAALDAGAAAVIDKHADPARLRSVVAAVA